MAFSNILDYEDSLHHSIAVFNLTETDICMEVELLFVLILLSPWSVINLPCIVIYLPSMPQVELCLHSITAIICLVSFATFNCPPSCPDHFWPSSYHPGYNSLYIWTYLPVDYTSSSPLLDNIQEFMTYSLSVRFFLYPTDTHSCWHSVHNWSCAYSCMHLLNQQIAKFFPQCLCLLSAIPRDFILIMTLKPYGLCLKNFSLL